MLCYSSFLLPFPFHPTGTLKYWENALWTILSPLTFSNLFITLSSDTCTSGFLPSSLSLWLLFSGLFTFSFDPRHQVKRRMEERRSPCCQRHFFLHIVNILQVEESKNKIPKSSFRSSCFSSLHFYERCVFNGVKIYFMRNSCLHSCSSFLTSITEWWEN